MQYTVQELPPAFDHLTRAVIKTLLQHVTNSINLYSRATVSDSTANKTTKLSTMNKTASTRQ